MKVIKSWVTGKPQGNYLASIALEIEFSGGYRFQLRGMRLITIGDRAVLAMANIRGPQGNWQDIVIPLNQQTREVLEEAAIQAWRRTGPPQEIQDRIAQEL